MSEVLCNLEELKMVRLIRDKEPGFEISFFLVIRVEYMCKFCEKHYLLIQRAVVTKDNPNENLMLMFSRKRVKTSKASLWEKRTSKPKNSFRTTRISSNLLVSLLTLINCDQMVSPTPSCDLS
jgi:type IV secretory pathway VirB3-like protein